MRILVFSDTHKSIDECIVTINNIPGVDMVLHAGDHCSDAKELQKAFPEIPVKFVKGNCDFSDAPVELLVEAEGKRIFITHGHMYNVKSEYNYDAIKERGKELNADVIVFGHTHIPYNEKFADFAVLNPGSIKYGRTYGVIEVENGKIGTAVCDFVKIM